MTKKVIFSSWLLFTVGMATVVFNSCKKDEGDIAVTGISLNVPTLALTIGEDYMLVATVTPINATDQTVTWTSSDDSKATVVDGKVTAIAVGSVIITAKAGDKTATCAVDISPIDVTGISLNISTLILIIGKEYVLTATVIPNNATDQSITWTSSDNSIATVVDGKLKAIAEGEVVITAKAGDKTATCIVSVKDPLTYDEGVIINGTKWATRNVAAPGTFAVNSEFPGMLYQWNRNMGWRINSNDDNIWDGSLPSGTTWEQSNDPSPEGWRVPTLDELESLLDTDKVSNEWAVQNGIGGRKFTDKTTGNSLFLPAVGYRNWQGTPEGVGVNGGYWTNTQYDEWNAYRLAFGSDYADSGYTTRRFAFSVRCIEIED